jgi:ribosomal 30S subunit maturation factor RimM
VTGVQTCALPIFENVELYKNQEIFVKKEELDDVDDDEIYVNDLIGMKVIANDLHGTVNNFYNYGGGDTIEVIWSNGDRDDIPFVEPYITKIDKKNLVIYIEKPTYI